MFNLPTIYSKQQAAILRTVRQSGGFAGLEMIQKMISEAQLLGESDIIDIQMVVKKEVSDWFKSNANIKVTDTAQGQPQGFVKILTIDWQ